MLVHLSIHNYALVDQLDLELAPGMTAITGETGAGKSIMLDALSLALGDRATADAVRPGADKADILASFDIHASSSAQNWLSARDLDNDELCILRRVITREGRSRGYINGTPCPLSDLKELGELLIDIHSQHEHQSLLKTETQRRLLDEYAGIQELAQQVQHSSQRWRQTRNELTALQQKSQEHNARQQLLSYQLEELEQLALADGEVEQLEQQHKTLGNAGQLLGQCQQVLDLCQGEDSSNILSALNACLNRLSSATHNKSLQEAYNLLSSAQIQIEEALGEINHFVDHFEDDPALLQQIEERLDVIYRLARKHKVQPSELCALQHSLRADLQELNACDSQIEQLSQELCAFEQHYQSKAQELSERRSEAAPKLAQTVEQELQRLGMPGGRLVIELKPQAQAEPQAGGLEQCEFLVSANPGQPPRSLGKVASGGELSRISLAIQVITAQTSQVPTLVFDEVDVGIGGPTAEIVGQLLRRLGERGQVLCVTHLAQVAAQGHQQLFVRKSRGEGVTSSEVCSLNQTQRAEELARMIGGVELTDESLAHAQKMLSKANS